MGISTHIWGSSPLLLIPLAGYVGFRVALDAGEDVSPMLANLPVLIGLGMGSVMVASLHFYWECHATFVALTPLLMFAGELAVAGLGELWRWRSWYTGALLALEGILAGAGLYLFRQLRRGRGA